MKKFSKKRLEKEFTNLKLKNSPLFIKNQEDSNEKRDIETF